MGQAVGQLAGLGACDVFQGVGRVAHEPLGEDLPRRNGELDGVVGVEVTLHLDHAGGQQRRAAFDEGAAGAIVDDDGSAGCDSEADPELAR